jgi:ATP-dependent DNA ligase
MRAHEIATSSPGRTRKRQSGLDALPIPVNFAPMEAKLVDALPVGPAWQFEPKWDGFRCLAFRAGDEVELRAKSGKTLSRYFPEVLEFLRALPIDHFVIDGELAIPQGDVLAFDALQMRLHPAASRIRKLSQETPAMLILFDCLMSEDRKSLVELPLTARRDALESLFERFEAPASLRLSPYTRKRADAQRWLDQAGGSLDGVVAKRLDGAYISGERAMQKVKRMRTADCVVGGFRYATDSKLVGSLLLGLYNDEGKLDHVGFTSSIQNSDRAALTKKLEALIAEPGFSGSAPGSPSRWSNERTAEWKPLKNELVVEVCYDHVSARRFRHGTRLLRWRPDKAPRQCTFEQLQLEARPAKLVKAVMRGGAPAKRRVHKRV